MCIHTAPKKKKSFFFSFSDRKYVGVCTLKARAIKKVMEKVERGIGNRSKRIRDREQDSVRKWIVRISVYVAVFVCVSVLYPILKAVWNRCSTLLYVYQTNGILEYLCQPVSQPANVI